MEPLEQRCRGDRRPAEEGNDAVQVQRWISAGEEVVQRRAVSTSVDREKSETHGQG